MSDSRLVYSTGNRVCPKCGWPADNCQCSSNRKPNESVPNKVVAKLRIEKTGRGGKTVTVVYDLPNNEDYLKGLCTDLKKACGIGGAVSENTIELQGDQRERVRKLLTDRGMTVKGN